MKFGATFACLLSGVILAVVGFDQRVTVQTEEELAGLRAAFIIVPATGTLIGIWAMWNYDLNEEQVRAIRSELDARQSA